MTFKEMALTRQSCRDYSDKEVHARKEFAKYEEKFEKEISEEKQKVIDARWT